MTPTDPIVLQLLPTSNFYHKEILLFCCGVAAGVAIKELWLEKKIFVDAQTQTKPLQKLNPAIPRTASLPNITPSEKHKDLQEKDWVTNLHIHHPPDKSKIKMQQSKKNSKSIKWSWAGWFSK